MIQNLKREYQAVSAERNKLQDFFKKQEEEKQKESLMKQHAKQIDLYNKMLAVQKRRQKKEKYIMIRNVTATTMKEVLKMTFMKKKKRDLQKKITEITLTVLKMMTLITI